MLERFRQTTMKVVEKISRKKPPRLPTADDFALLVLKGVPLNVVKLEVRRHPNLPANKKKEIIRELGDLRNYTWDRPFKGRSAQASGPLPPDDQEGRP